MLIPASKGVPRYAPDDAHDRNAERVVVTGIRLRCGIAAHTVYEVLRRERAYRHAADAGSFRRHLVACAVRDAYHLAGLQTHLRRSDEHLIWSGLAHLTVPVQAELVHDDVQRDARASSFACTSPLPWFDTTAVRIWFVLTWSASAPDRSLTVEELKIIPLYMTMPSCRFCRVVVPRVLPSGPPRHPRVHVSMCRWNGSQPPPEERTEDR